MNESAKVYMRKVKNLIVEGLEGNFPDIPLYEDEVPEEKTAEYDNGTPYRLMVMKMGPVGKQENATVLSQEFTVDLYLENSPDVDETTLDVIVTVKGVPNVIFDNSTKFRARHANANRFVDVVSMNFTRRFKVECKI
ncbi:hypothetical protein QT711_03360 [Sporosarcina saromensis]|uniref:Minor capsid protein n=1 Tax=Sporosarcina saromensis TaxID=359365 RepID=A0ABU4G7B7_9BACL|nr:hypothetical protein [Sporosarcina saromensis]MDW0112208.1 hypothetical protein [Sporosarcina saromensis]